MAVLPLIGGGHGQDQLGSCHCGRAVGGRGAERVRLRVLRRGDEERHGGGDAGARQAATSHRRSGPVVHLPGLHLWDWPVVGVCGDPPPLRRGPQDRRDRGGRGVVLHRAAAQPAGPAGGWIANDTPVAALRLRARAWWRSSGPDLQLSIEPTHFSGAWFTDAGVGAVFERGPAIASIWTTVRLSGVYGSTGAASAFVQLFATPTIALELAGGSYLRDPYQGLPRAGFVTLGVRLHTSPRLPRADPSAARWSPLVPQLRGDSLVVRFRFDSVRAVAIAGDWNQWQPVPLRSLGASLWEGTLALKRGLYHCNLLVDGSDWAVPTGVATVPDGLGGMVGVLLVP